MRLGCVVMASGHSKRFGSDKLIYRLDGGTIAGRTLDALPPELFVRVLVVTRSEAVAELALERGFVPVMNSDTTDDTAQTIRLGIENLPEDIDGCMFSVCDQPYLTRESIHALVSEFHAAPQKITALAFKGERGNPVIFPQSLLNELSSLPPNKSGSHVIRAHPERLSLVEVSSGRELFDIDTTGNIV